MSSKPSLDLMSSKLSENQALRTRELLKLQFSEALLYGVSSKEFSLGRSDEQVLGEMLQGGLRLFQFRAKHENVLSFERKAKRLAKMASRASCLFIINDRIDIALEVADGVHLGLADTALGEAISLREKAGRTEDFLIGRSTHSFVEADEAILAGADYFNLGPIFPTKTKICKQTSELGLKTLKEILIELHAKHSSLPPFSVMGGIKEEHFEALFCSGAKTMAMISEITGQKNIAEKVASMLYSLHNLKEKFAQFDEEIGSK